MSLSDSIREQLVASLTDAEHSAYTNCCQQLQQLQTAFWSNNDPASYTHAHLIMSLLRTLKAKRQDPNLDGAARTLYGELGRTLLDDPAFQQAMGIAEDPEKEKTFAATLEWKRPRRYYLTPTAKPNAWSARAGVPGHTHYNLSDRPDMIVCECDQVLQWDGSSAPLTGLMDRLWNTHRLNVLEERGFDTRKLPQ